MKTGIICIGDNIFETLLAISEAEQQRGLMFVEPPVPVMSFVYAQPQINKFWMRSTPAPLDILFCHKGELTQICFGEPHSTAMIGDNRFSDLVIELPYGMARRSGIKLGHRVSWIKPTHEQLLQDIFAGNFR